MPIDVSCGDCQKRYRLADQMAGKKAKCKACGGIIHVPADDAAPVAPVPKSRSSQTSSQSSARSSKPAARPARATPVEPVYQEPIDPFDFDALVASESTAQIDDNVYMPPSHAAPTAAVRRSKGTPFSGGAVASKSSAWAMQSSDGLEVIRPIVAWIALLAGYGVPLAINGMAMASGVPGAGGGLFAVGLTMFLSKQFACAGVSRCADKNNFELPEDFQLRVVSAMGGIQLGLVIYLYFIGAFSNPEAVLRKDGLMSILGTGLGVGCALSVGLLWFLLNLNFGHALVSWFTAVIYIIGGYIMIAIALGLLKVVLGGGVKQGASLNGSISRVVDVRYEPGLLG